MLEKEETVLVTGGSGYLAGWMIVGLLHEGYKVRTTLRSPDRQSAVIAALASQVESVNRLSFAVTDLVRDDGWEEAMSGCDYALHVASPMGRGTPTGADLVGPARDGTLRVLRAAAASGVRRVVCTSSAVAAQPPTVSGQLGSTFGEDTWTDLSQKGLSEYIRSKTLAERAVWNFKESDVSGMTVATVLPGLILGPVMTQSSSGSLELISRLLTGRVPALPNVGFGITETQDLVDLHLRAMTNPSAANQRFLGVGDFLWLSDIAQILKEQFPEHSAKIPVRQLPDWVLRMSALFNAEARQMVPMLRKQTRFNSSKATELLQWKPHPSKEAVIACATSLVDHGAV